ncbi:MAG: type II secretion system F family protein [Candidatus Wildermuthbacteria bacterium]|nr:type II secretion system F family protein [Candidatus Wildermuthbacteria bacterium]
MKFGYRAADEQGRHQEGFIQASSEQAALQVLDRHGLYITQLEEAREEPLYARRITLFDRVSENDVMLFSRQLAIMFKSRVSLVDSLTTIGSQLKRKSFKSVIFQVSQDVEAGTAFSDALTKHPNVFSFFYVNMVKRGETLGKLSEVLQYLADHLEREHQLKSKIRGALVYPIFVVVVAFAVVTLASIMVLPNLTQILEESGSELPLLTRVVIAFSNFYRQWWWAIVVAVVAAVVGILRLAKTTEGRKVVHRVLLRIPIIGNFLRMMYVSRFGENLSTLITGGVPIVEAMGITGRIVGNEAYEHIIQQAKDSVSQGSKVADVFERYPKEFPPTFTQMIKVGEKTGALDETLAEIVTFYRGEMNRSVDAFIALIEPLLIVVLGVVVGGVMASLMLPLYQSITTGFQ